MSDVKTIAFYAGSSIPIHAYSLDERPLGGTETGVIRLAEALSTMGYEVTVFTSHQDPPISSPRYLPANQLFRHGPFDLLVLVQEWKGALFNLPAKRVWFLTGDGPEQYSTYGLGDLRTIKTIEKLLTVSTYHKSSLCEESGFPLEKTFVIGNGVHLPYFEGSEERVTKRLIFTSAPYRGLSLVPQMLLALQGKHPDLEFHTFSGMKLYDRDRPFAGPQVAHYEAVANILKKIPHCTVHGNVTQKILAREYLRSSIFFYPCTVPETCCITALEAQAAGCAIVTSSLGALPETVAGAGVCIDFSLSQTAFSEQFVKATDEILSDPTVWKKYSEYGRSRTTTDLGWAAVAKRFMALI